MVYRYVEPFWMFGLSETSLLLWAGLGVLLLATVFVRNLYCRFLCPVGADARPGVARDRLPDQALVGVQHLPICEKTCEWGAIQGPKILMTECVRCDDCERIYADEAKCPHWRILDYKKREGRRDDPRLRLSAASD